MSIQIFIQVIFINKLNWNIKIPDCPFLENLRLRAKFIMNIGNPAKILLKQNVSLNSHDAKDSYNWNNIL